jgi:hypothetical protein
MTASWLKKRVASQKEAIGAIPLDQRPELGAVRDRHDGGGVDPADNLVAESWVRGQSRLGGQRACSVADQNDRQGPGAGLRQSALGERIGNDREDREKPEDHDGGRPADDIPVERAQDHFGRNGPKGRREDQLHLGPERDPLAVAALESKVAGRYDVEDQDVA